MNVLDLNSHNVNLNSHNGNLNSHNMFGAMKMLVTHFKRRRNDHDVMCL